MYVISKSDGDIFSIQSCESEKIEEIKQAMQQDAEVQGKTISFIEMTEQEYHIWQEQQPKPIQEPTEIEQLRLEMARSNTELFETMLMLNGGA